MKRFIFIIILFCSCISVFAQKGLVIVHSDSSTRKGLSFPNVCIRYKNLNYHCYSFVEALNKDSVKCMILCRAVDLSDTHPTRKPVGEIVYADTLRLNKRGRGKEKLQREVTTFLREPQWEEKAVYLHVSYDINTKNGKKSTVSYYFTEKADKN